MKLGIDIGNGYTKYSLNKKFVSRIKAGRLEEVNEEVHSVVYEGVPYLVGDSTGVQITSDDKYFNKEYKILLLTAIALYNPKTPSPIDADVVIGVPPAFYTPEFRKKIINTFVGTINEIKVDGIDYIINICNMQVMQEGSVPIKTNFSGKLLVFDIGARTIDVILWNNKRVSYSMSFEQSFISLAIKTANYLNNPLIRFGISNDQVLSGDYIGKAKVMNPKTGKLIDTPVLVEYLRETILSVVSQVQALNEFESGLCEKIVVIGGGAENDVCCDVIKDTFGEFRVERMKDSQYINQQIYDMCAKVLFNEK